MNKTLRASRDCAIALTSALRDFSKNPTEQNLRKAMNHHGLSGSKAPAVMHCLRDMGCVTSHGRHGNKSHFSRDFRTSQVVSRLHRRGEI